MSDLIKTGEEITNELNTINRNRADSPYSVEIDSLMDEIKELNFKKWVSLSTLQEKIKEKLKERPRDVDMPLSSESNFCIGLKWVLSLLEKEK